MLLPATVFDSNGAVYFEDGAPIRFQSGFGFTANGRIATSTINGALPAGAITRNGFSFTSDGRLLIAADQSVAGAVVNNGALFQSQGALHVSSGIGGISQGGFLRDSSGRLQGGGVLLPGVTWNPLDKEPNITLSNGNRTAIGTNTGQSVRGTVGKSSGKWYFEITRTSGPDLSFNVIGIATAAFGLTSTGVGIEVGTGYGYGYTGHRYPGTGGSSVEQSSVTVGQVWQVAVDFDNLRMFFGKNNTFLTSSAVADPTVPAQGYTFTAGTYYPACTSRQNEMTINNPLVYTPPSGYSVWA